MVLGINGKLLRVNLNDFTWQVETIEDSFWRVYYGGWGLIAYYLLKELRPGIDSTTLAPLVYKVSFRYYDLGKGAAIGMVLMIISLIFGAIYLQIVKAEEKLSA